MMLFVVEIRIVLEWCYKSIDELGSQFLKKKKIKENKMLNDYNFYACLKIFCSNISVFDLI